MSSTQPHSQPGSLSLNIRGLQLPGSHQIRVFVYPERGNKAWHAKRCVPAHRRRSNYSALQDYAILAVSKPFHRSPSYSRWVIHVRDRITIHARL
jgi:hypothetical protein